MVRQSWLYTLEIKPSTFQHGVEPPGCHTFLLVFTWNSLSSIPRFSVWRLRDYNRSPQDSFIPNACGGEKEMS